MKQKEDKIEVTEQVIWEWLQKHYQEYSFSTETGNFTNALIDFWKIYNDNKTELNQIRLENDVLKKTLAIKIDEMKQLQKSYDLACARIGVLRQDISTQVKVDLLNKVKERLLPFGKSDVVFPEMIDDIIKEVQL